MGMWSAKVTALLLGAAWLAAAAAADAEPQRLPDTSGITGELTASYGVDGFFSLWLVFNNDDNVHMSEEPFTIFTPLNNNDTQPAAERLLSQPAQLKRLLLDHIVLGVRLELSLSSAIHVTALGGRTIHVRRINGTQYANGARVVLERVDVPGGILVVVDGYLFPEDLEAEAAPPAAQSLVKVTAPPAAPTAPAPGHDANSTFLENVSHVLSFLKSGVRVFRDFLSRSNVSQLLKEGEEYTVFVPIDNAFQRWHPIDWGFYPFSVPEFTESIMINHFVKGNLRQNKIKDGQTAVTLGGREIHFSKEPNSGLSVNGAAIVNGDTPVSGGNIMFIGEVLFVNDGVVQRLHMENRDKETPPLLAFPWFGSQFLSHAFLALEEKEQFTHITRFVNLADLAPHITGSGYTFFVPTDEAFERLGIDKMPNNYLSTGDGFQVLLNHFVKGRLYKRDLTDGKQFLTLGNKTLHIRRHEDNITVNDANIVESEVFVYNLGTMYYIDHVLFLTKADIPTTTDLSTTTDDVTVTSTTEYSTDVESVPSELVEENGNLTDILLEELDTPATSESNDLLDTEMGSSLKNTLNSDATTSGSVSLQNKSSAEPQH
ncbi:transforming growth factor-beta-induced protein ig-h3 [Schistocerca gregaria]|uniref:transforming growth factor-beta-induced protein ig-h3 n=1 Tax=Schistocerca gregaria TaxID=7010 RepID=UPI00211F0717|nr:transforming growth factor-beta-induced protein ig-h3 [Schistocerca gregaria]